MRICLNKEFICVKCELLNFCAVRIYYKSFENMFCAFIGRFSGTPCMFWRENVFPSFAGIIAD